MEQRQALHELQPRFLRDRNRNSIGGVSASRFHTLPSSSTSENDDGPRPVDFEECERARNALGLSVQHLTASPTAITLPGAPTREPTSTGSTSRTTLTIRRRAVTRAARASASLRTRLLPLPPPFLLPFPSPPQGKAPPAPLVDVTTKDECREAQEYTNEDWYGEREDGNQPLCYKQRTGPSYGTK